MERALIDFSTGKVLQPVRTILPVEQFHGFFGIMPAVYGDIMGAKLVTLFPKQRRSSGFPLTKASSCCSGLRRANRSPRSTDD